MGVRSWLKRQLRGEARPAEPAPKKPPPSMTLPSAPDGDGYVAVAAADVVTPEHPGTYAVGDDIVAVFRAGGSLYAIDNACVHEDGPLGEGHVEDGVVVCPYHDWRYELATGACLSEPGRAVGCFAVRERRGFIWVGPRTSRPSRERGGEHDDGLPTAGDPSSGEP